MSHRPYRRRNDRLKKLSELLRTLDPQRPGVLAELLHVSVPAVCRDIAELQMQGLPIEGNAASGWRFLRQAAIGPLSFSSAELEALLSAWRLARPQLAPPLAQQAAAALERMLAWLPPQQRADLERSTAFEPLPSGEPKTPQLLETLQRACEARRLLCLVHRAGDASQDEQRVRPLGCARKDGIWWLTAWLEEAGDFACWRIDRLVHVAVLEDTFEDEPGRTLADLQERCAAGGKVARCDDRDMRP